jgi:hypothetical protein
MVKRRKRLSAFAKKRASIELAIYLAILLGAARSGARA